MFFVISGFLITSHLVSRTPDTPRGLAAFWAKRIQRLLTPVVVVVVAILAVALIALPGSQWRDLAKHAIVVGASFVYGVISTYASPAYAYFSTFTRMWELGLGSLLACVFPRLVVLLKRLPAARIGLLWSGLVLIVGSCVLITPATPFPGWAALAPTIGAALVIAANGPRGALGLAVVLEPAQVQFVGNISYALYLWH